MKDPARCPRCGGAGRVVKCVVNRTLGYRRRRHVCGACPKARNRWTTYQSEVNPAPILAARKYFDRDRV